MFDDFMTPETLTTFTGLVLATALIVQFTKLWIKKIFTDAAVRLYTWIIALVLTFIFARNGQGIEGIVLTVINSILVATSAMGGYEIIADPKAEKKK
jgi:hypothetical protein